MLRGNHYERDKSNIGQMSQENVPCSSNLVSQNANIFKVPTESKNGIINPKSNVCVNEDNNETVKYVDIQ